MNWLAFWRGFRDGLFLVPCWIVSWVLFLAGDLVSRLDGIDPQGRHYPVYNWLMVTSSRMQILDCFGPWRPARSDEGARD